jgi:hypothetical protein
MGKYCVEADCRQVPAVPGRPLGAAQFPAALPAAHEQVRTLPHRCGDGRYEAALALVLPVKAFTYWKGVFQAAAKLRPANALTCDDRPEQ